MTSDDDRFGEFLGAAAAYIDLIKTTTNASKALAVDLVVALTALYATGARLPYIRLPDDTDPNKHVPGDRRAPAGYAQTDARLRSVLDDATFSWETWSWDLIPPYVEYERSEIVSDLSNDLAEVYEDVLNYAAKLSRPEHTVQARWEVRFGFWGHTGDHIVNALRLLHPEAGAGGHGPPEQEAAG